MFKNKKINILNIYFLTPSPVGLEPTTYRLTADRATCCAIETIYNIYL